ncbi:MAG: hypothetical protein LBR66_07845, partial [Candidatus Symbiothrix sp.]|nr:hypothetical protein [Candidatus Symbiothrix sp.]
MKKELIFDFFNKRGVLTLLNSVLIAVFIAAGTWGAKAQDVNSLSTLYDLTTNGGSAVGTLNSFDLGSLADFTLEVTGAVAATPVSVANGLISYTPTANGKVRFACENGVIYVFENDSYKGTVSIDDTKVTYPDLFSETDNSTNATGIYNSANLLQNPGFETIPNTVWFAYDANNASLSISNIASSGTSLRTHSTIEGANALLMHGGSKWLTQSIAAGSIQPYSFYSIKFIWHNNDGGTQAGAVFRVDLGTTERGTDIVTTATVTSPTNTNNQTFDKTILTGDINISNPVWFAMERTDGLGTGSAQKLDWYDHFALVEGDLSLGISGATAAVYLSGTAYKPTAVITANLENAIVTAQTLYGDGSGINAAALNTAIATAQSILSSAITQTDIDNAVISLNAAILVYQLDNAPGNALDYTSYIANPNFETYTGDKDQTISGWTKTGTSSTEYCIRTDAGPAGKTGTGYFQHWSGSNPRPDFSISQTITGLPNGIYKLTAFAGTGAGLFIYADNAQTEIAAAEDYEVTATVTNGSLTIGYKSVSRTDSWAYADNFRLAYYGTEVYAATNLLNAAITTANAISMPACYGTALSDAITTATTALGSGSASDMTTALNNLNAAIDAANAYLLDYGKLAAAISFAQSLPTTYAGYTGVFDAAIATAQTVYGGSDVKTQAEINAATATLTAATRTYRLTQAASFNNPANFTFAITNPQFDEGTAGWTTDMSTYQGTNTQYNGWTNYSDNTSIYTVAPSANIVLDKNSGTLPWEAEQAVSGLPAGYYRVKVVARGSATSETTMFISASATTAGTVQANISRVGDTGNDLNYGWKRYEIPYLKLLDNEALTLGVNVTASGWASVDNFELWYYGNELTDAQGHLLILQDVYADANALATTSDPMQTGILNTLRDALDSYASLNALTISTVQDNDDAAILAATTALSNALADAQSSKGKYAAYYSMYGKMVALVNTYKTALAATDINTDAIDAIYLNANSAYTGKTIEGTLAEIISLQSSVDDAVAALGLDLTSGYIANPTTTATGEQTAVPTGWTGVERGNNYSTSGQYPNNSSKTYLDSWNGTTGALKFTVNQAVTLPEGSYVLSAEARTDGDGSYIYVQVGSSYYKAEIFNYGASNGVLTGGWSKYYVAFTVPAGGAGVTLGITNNTAERLDGTGNAWSGTWYSATNFSLLYFDPDFVIDADDSETYANYVASNKLNIVFNEGSQLTGASASPVNGVVKVVKTFATDKWYPIGFPFAIDDITVEYGLSSSKAGVIYNGTEAVPTTQAEIDVFTPSGNAATANIYLAKYIGGANYFQFTDLGANMGYVIEFPKSDFGGEESVTVTFTSAPSPSISSTASAEPTVNSGDYV